MTTEGYGSADSKELQPSGALQQQALSAKQVSFDNLDDVDFEEFCFELLGEIGFVNVDWRKGTAKRSSPSDRGRDIVAYHPRVDVDGHQYLEEWFVDTKHYKTWRPHPKHFRLSSRGRRPNTRRSRWSSPPAIYQTRQKTGSSSTRRTASRPFASAYGRGRR